MSPSGLPLLITRLVGFNITITFSVSTVPFVAPRNITWIFQDNANKVTEILPTVRYSFSIDKLSLTIYNIHEEDEGNFTLIAKNTIGQGQASIQLIVDG